MLRRVNYSRFLVILALILAIPSVWAGHRVFNSRAVGGISVAVDGVLSLPAVEDRRLLRDELAKAIRQPSADLNQPVEMRMISLRGLEAAVGDALQNNLGHLPEEVRFLAGLQRVQYVFIYPEKNDIVLAGPGEGWKVDDLGNVVGVTSGLPVMRLDDLVIALRTVENARRGGILCSIDPTEQGLKQFEQVVHQAGRRMQPGVVEALERAMGPQTIRVEGVPDSSHFARVMVASDYRMKRYAMDLDPAPVKGFVSFPTLLKTKRMGIENMLPRWWLACDYEPLAKSADGLAWELRGPGVKVMTETEIVVEGKRERTGKTSPAAQTFAEMFTTKYAAICAKDPIFGELRNVMDLCVIAALIEREGLLDQVQLKLTNLTADESKFPFESYNSPKTVSTRASVTKSGRDYIITASGGVEINSWQVVEKSKVDPAIEQIRAKASPTKVAGFWWE